MTKTPPDTETPPKPNRGKRRLLLGATALLLAGGGASYAASVYGLLGALPHEGNDNRPQLVRKGEDEPYALPSAPADGETAGVVHGEGGQDYRTAYFDFAEEFTSNLAGGDALIQVSLAAATRYDGRVLMWLGAHETAVRSRILAELAATPAASLDTVTGKTALQKRLTSAVNEVLAEREGFGGVDQIYFRALIVQ